VVVAIRGNVRIVQQSCKVERGVPDTSVGSWQVRVRLRGRVRVRVLCGRFTVRLVCGLTGTGDFYGFALV